MDLRLTEVLKRVVVGAKMPLFDLNSTVQTSASYLGEALNEEKTQQILLRLRSIESDVLQLKRC